MVFELTLYQILRNMICLYLPGYPSVRICFSNVTNQAVFLHQPPYFLHVHDNRRILMQKPHMDSLCSFLIAPKVIGF